jgi:chromosome segregation ATPase
MGGETLIAGVIGALATLVVGGLAAWLQYKALKVQLTQLRTAKEEAERQRQDAIRARDEASQAREAALLAQGEATRAREEAERARDECRHRAQTYIRHYEAAPQRFTKTIGDAIAAAVEAARVHGPTSTELLDAARTLIKVRDDLRSALEVVSTRLNSHIDSLSKEVERKQVSAGEIQSLVNILNGAWPAKTQEIELALRKVLTDMGLEPLRA